MKSTPDPAFCFVTSIHTDISKTFHRIEQARHDEAKTGLATGSIRARQAESFRKEKLALSGARSSDTGPVVAAPGTSSRNPS
jgi:hypothetical protein